jgi:hypothetical protein
MFKLKNKEQEVWCSKLGFSNDDIDCILTAISFELATLYLCELKERINKNWKKLAQELHPDHGGNVEDFKSASMVYVELKKFLSAITIPNTKLNVETKSTVIYQYDQPFTNWWSRKY